MMKHKYINEIPRKKGIIYSVSFAVDGKIKNFGCYEDLQIAIKVRDEKHLELKGCPVSKYKWKGRLTKAQAEKERERMCLCFPDDLHEMINSMRSVHLQLLVKQYKKVYRFLKRDLYDSEIRFYFEDYIEKWKDWLHFKELQNGTKYHVPYKNMEPCTSHKKSTPN